MGNDVEMVSDLEKYMTRYIFLLEENIQLLDLDFAIQATKLLSNHLMTLCHPINTQVANIIVKILQYVPQKYMLAVWMIDEEKNIPERFREVLPPPKWFHDQLLLKFQESYRKPVTTSVKVLGEWQKTLTELVKCCRRCWTDVSCVSTHDFDPTSSDIFIQSGLMKLFMPMAKAYEVDYGPWEILPVCFSTSWEQSWTAMLARASEYAWANNLPSLNAKYNPRIIHHLTRLLLKVPELPKSSAVEYTETRKSTDCSHIVESEPLYYFRNVAEVLIYNIKPFSESPEMFNNVLDLLRLLAPYTHSEIKSKEDKNIATFISEIMTAYCNRVGRERHPASKVRKSRLGRQEDLALINVLLPMALSGIFKSNSGSREEYTDALCTLAALDPISVLPKISEATLHSLSTTTEPMSMIVTLALYHRLARLMLTYQPATVAAVISLVEKSFVDFSEINKSLHFAGLYFAIVTNAPVLDYASHVDPYNLNPADLQKVFTPLFGYKTSETQSLFDDMEAKYPFYSLQNYPSETLTDPEVERLDDQAPRMTDDGELNLLVSYQTPDEIRIALQLRFELASQLATWAESLVSAILTGITKVNTSEASVGDDLASAIKGVILYIVTKLDAETHQKIVDKILQWLITHENTGCQQLINSVVSTVAAFPGKNTLKQYIDKIFPMIVMVNPQGKLSRNKRFGKPRQVWLANIIRATMLLCSREHVKECKEDIAKLSWVMIQSASEAMSKSGLKLCDVYAQSLTDTSPRSTSAPGKRLKTPTENFLSWGFPRWLDLTSKNYQVEFCYVVEPITWTTMTEDDLKSALGMITSVAFKYCKTIQQNLEITGWSIEAISSAFAQAAEGHLISLPDVETADIDPAESSNIKSRKFTAFIRIARMFKRINTALGQCTPDEREVNVEGLLTVGAIKSPIGSILLANTRDFVVAASRKYMGLNLSKSDQLHIGDFGTPLDKSGDMDIVKVSKKLINTTNKALGRSYFSATPAEIIKNVEIWKQYYAWTDVRARISNLAFLANLIENVYVDKSYYLWDMRNYLRRSNLPLSGARLDLINLTLSHTNYLYADVRIVAQTSVLDAAATHARGNAKIAEYIVSAFVVLAQKFVDLNVFTPVAPSPAVQSGGSLRPEDDVEPTEAVVCSAMIEETIIQEPLPHIPVVHGEGAVAVDHPSKKSVKSRLDVPGPKGTEDRMILQVNITGLLYLLVEKRIYSQLGSESKARLIASMIDLLSHPVDNESLKNRIIMFVRFIFENRTACNPGDARKLLDKTLSTLDKITYWRGKIICLATIVTNIHPEVLRNQTELINRIGLTLARLNKQNAGLQVILTELGLGILLYLIVHGNIIRSTETEIGTLIECLIQDRTVIDNIWKVIPICHLQLRKKSTDQIYSVIIDIIRMEISWPRLRIMKFWKSMTVHCCLLAQTYMEFIHKFSPQSINKIVEKHVVPILNELSNHPISDDESHAAVALSVAGIIAATRNWSTQSMVEIFTYLQPIVTTEMGRFTEFSVWLDAARYMIHQGPSDQPVLSDVYVTLVHNLIINGVVVSDRFVAISEDPEGEDIATKIIDSRRKVVTLKFMNSLYSRYPECIRLHLTKILQPNSPWIFSAHSKLNEDSISLVLDILSTLEFQRPKKNHEAEIADKQLSELYSNIFKLEVPKLLEALTKPKLGRMRY